MKIYIASHSRENALELAEKLNERGHTVTSRWIWLDTKFHMGMRAYSASERSDLATMDEEDVRAAVDGVVVIAEPEGRMVPGGKHVESGIALGLGRSLCVIGRRENVFHWHPKVRVFRDSGEYLRHLVELQKTQDSDLNQGLERPESAPD